MTIVTRPSSVQSLLGGSIELPVHACGHDPAVHVSPWVGEPGTAGTVAVVGAGKMGLPLCAQFADHDWHVIAVDVNQAVVDSINAGKSHVGEEPGLAELVAAAHAGGRLRATTDGAAAAREADVVVLIVPVMLDDEQQPDYRYMDAAVASIAPGVHAGSLVIFETTLPVGDTRGRFLPQLVEASGLTADKDLFVAFSPERLYSGAALKNLATYPKLVGGIGPASTDRAARFYDAVLDTEVVAMSNAEAAEFSKLADTTYRDVNIALANEFARYAERAGVDIHEVIAAANSQPYSHIHQPGIGVGGHCIPVYPHFLLGDATDGELSLVRDGRQTNDRMAEVGVAELREALGDLGGRGVLVLGASYREDVKELAFSTAFSIVDLLHKAGARVMIHDPLFKPGELAGLESEVVALDSAEAAQAEAVIIQAWHREFRNLDWARFKKLRVVLDGRGSVDAKSVAGATYIAIGISRSGARSPK
jgi:nucleotide sugar dehydrogenase